MPTPARRAISSSVVVSPPSANTSRAASSSRSWFRRASARLGPGGGCSVEVSAVLIQSRIEKRRLPPYYSEDPSILAPSQDLHELAPTLTDTARLAHGKGACR